MSLLAFCFCVGVHEEQRYILKKPQTYLHTYSFELFASHAWLIAIPNGRVHSSPSLKAHAPNRTVYSVFLTQALDISLERAQLFATVELDFSKEMFSQPRGCGCLTLVDTALGLNYRFCSNTPELLGLQDCLRSPGHSSV